MPLLYILVGVCLVMLVLILVMNMIMDGSVTVGTIFEKELDNHGCMC
ncbi:MAG: hypothetical protein ACI3XG_03040 [Faecousia sp.]